MKGARPLSAAFLLLVSLGCARGPSVGAGDTLRIAQLTSCITLDPHRHDSTYTNVTLGHFYDRLVNFGPNLELLPELAVRWESPSEFVWHLHLREHVTFHDGRPFEAEDVVASLKRAAAAESHQRHYVRGVREVRAVDPLTVELVTDGAAPVLLNELAFVMIVPRGTGPAEVTHPVGTGPYRFVSGKPGGLVVGERFERWWGPPPAYGRLEISSMPDDGEREAAIPNGRTDIIAQFPPEAWERTKRSREARLDSRPGLTVEFINFSVAPGSPFADLRVRRAVALALDRDALVAVSPEGLTVAAWQPVPPTVFGFAHDLPHPPRDLAAARRLLAEAGHPEGLRSQLVSSRRVENLAKEVVRQLAGAGITLDLVVLSQKDFYDGVLHGEMPVFIDSYAASTGDAANMLESEVHSNGGGLGTFNVTGYRNEALDALIDKAARTVDTRMRRDVLADAMKLVAEDVPVVPLVVRSDIYAFRRGLRWEPRHARLTAADVSPER